MQPSLPSPTRAFIALGANLGDRVANIRTALEKLSDNREIRVLAVSSNFENPAVGGPRDAPPFLNGAAAIETTLDPAALLGVLLEVERQLGRLRQQKWEPRLIDLDLVLYGDRVINRPGLTVPHPLMQQRRFVLRPLAEIAPDAVHPVSGLSVAQMLKDLNRSELAAGEDRETRSH